MTAVSAKVSILRAFLSSEWTAAAVGLVLSGLHAAWFFASAHQAEVLSGFGSATTVLGVFVAAQPYIRKGLYETAREQVGLHAPGESPRLARKREDEAETEGVSHVLRERVFAAVLVSIGSVLNGYGPAIATALALRGS